MKHQLEQSISHCQFTSAGGHLLYVATKRLMYTSFLLLTHSLDCLQSLLVWISWPPMLHFLCALSHIWDSTPSSAVTSTLGGLLFHSVTTLPLLKYSQLFLSCLAEGSLTGMSLKKSPLVSQPSSLPIRW